MSAGGHILNQFTNRLPQRLGRNHVEKGGLLMEKALSFFYGLYYHRNRDVGLGRFALLAS